MVFISGLTGMFDIYIRFRYNFGIFLAMSIILFIFTRPIAIRKFKVGNVKTNVDELIGKNALVIKKISKYEKGEVKIKGQIWSAISDQDEEFLENSECVIIRIEGVKVVVSKMK
jgi:membrane protein implicated in regulation of membrane protease activity